MIPQEIIRRKRDGAALPAADIAAFVAGLTDGRVTEGQAAAFAMAVFFKGMTRDERVALTVAMRDSGAVLDWSDLPGPAVDKHSTGGVGDNVSLMLAPALAACGVFVPMISGRGLGHTGGTLDKFDSVPGYTTQPDNALFRRVTREAGCAIIGQTADLAPADKRLYSIRDVTATVESIDLIVASILSKKLAAGLDALVLDVKCGSGAFMDSPERATALARALVDVANGAGVKTSALITDMNEPLADCAGNAIEMRNAIDFLTGARRESRLWEVTCALGAEALALAGVADGRAKMEAAFHSGEAAERFGRMCALLGGPNDLMARPEAYLEAAPVVVDVAPTAPGKVTAIDARAVGVGVIGLGGGRTRPQDPIDFAVGYDQLAPIGAEVGAERPLGRVHARSQAQAEQAAAALRTAYTTGETAADNAVIIARIS